MSGICAVWRKDDPARTAGTLRALNVPRASGNGIALKLAGPAGVGVSPRFPTQEIFEDERVILACDADLTGVARRPETCAALYQRHGYDFVQKLTGDFSIVLWDKRERTMFAAVDRFGVNRLVYFENQNVLLIASRIDALLRSGEIEPDINPRAIVNFLNFTNNLAPETVFTAIRRLPPAHTLVASGRSMRIAPYWDMRYGVGDETNEGRLSARLEEVVEEAVKAHCKEEAPEEIGAFLSGGTDSSTVLGMMTRAKGVPAKAFSIGFEEQQFNELEYAEIAAKKFQAEHHTYLVSAKDCIEAVPQMVRHFDEPFANSSAIPTYFCARLAAQNGIRVLLGGDGGDELFGGNERYRIDKIFHLYQTVPAVLRKRLIEPVLHRLPFENGSVGKARRYVRRSNVPALERYFSYNFLCSHAPEEVFEGDFLAALGNYSVLEIPGRYYREAPARDHLDRLLYVDVKITLGDSDLPKVTQMAELAGVQTRFPFLDTAVAEFSGTLPARLKVKGLEKRYLFKRAFRDLLPAEIIQKKKHGFGIPVAYWLKSDPRLREFSRDILFSARALERGYFRRRFLEDLIRRHEADDSTYYGDIVWGFFVLELWHRQYVDQTVGAPA